MSKVLDVARREFTSTVGTKGFLIGVFIAPVLMIGAIVLIPRLISDKAPPIRGRVVVIDQSGAAGDTGIVAAIKNAYSPEVMQAERAARSKAVEQAAKDALPEGKMANDASQAAAAQAAEDLPQIAVSEQAPAGELDAQVEKLKEDLRADPKSEDKLLAIVVIDPNAVAKGEEGFGSYQVYMRTKLDDRFEQPLHAKVRDAIIGARVAATGQNYAELAQLMNVRPAQSMVVTETGERKSSGAAANLFLAIGFMMLMWTSVFTGGQYLMTTVIEEKASRVMEVLLSAVSPMQLMTGKILGQMSVAMTILVVYVGIGLVGLNQFNLLDLVSTKDLGLLLVYFLIAFSLLGAMMAAIGSAVTEMREAQALMTPVILIMIIPMMLWMPIARNPNSTFSTVVSMLPPVSPFAMVIRMAGTEEIPWWQYPASIVIGFVSVFVAIWLTSKIFRIGVLMYGKPPDLRTLIRWVRMA